MTTAALTMTQVSGMRRGTYVIGKINGRRVTMSRTRWVSNWIIIALYARKMSGEGLFDWGTLCDNIEWEGADKFCLGLTR